MAFQQRLASTDRLPFAHANCLPACQLSRPSGAANQGPKGRRPGANNLASNHTSPWGIRGPNNKDEAGWAKLLNVLAPGVITGATEGEWRKWILIILQEMKRMLCKFRHALLSGRLSG
ncbi:hypothetical protein IF1G_05595 [Cordyceps javanica]|uniref:Uncharacterized protein n=1 Tax=Cordyceps javanica TaxID=43265 RepID=A0A545VZ97_9HYPO|nr:hypothetical protein IF1G_05595 [Cordyceps javanica]TQW07034.1 hypothetical protein IF2G_05418 [Cordyceps javanica]